MSIIFAHDHKFRYINGNYYSIGGLNMNVLDRYIKIFGDITIIARVINEDNINNRYSKIDNKNIKIINRNEMEKEQIELLIKSNSFIIARLPSKIGSEVVYYAKKYKKKYLVEMVACPWDAFWNHSLKGKIIAPLITYITKKQVLNAPYVLYVTENFLQKRYPCKGKTVGISDVIITPMTELEKEKRFQKIKNINLQNKIKLGTAAAVNVKYKGQRFVIEALALLKKEGITNIEYHLAGGGDQTNLKEIAKKMDVFDQVVFHGSLKHEKVIDFLDDIDIYIQPSLQEGLPRAVVEAMSRGCPCIGANTGGIPELLMSSTICSRKNMAKDIVKKLEFVLNKENMLTLSKYSLEKSNDYRKEVLDNKRIKFMKQFIEYVNKENNLHI